jgi:hypothetical protein
MAFSRVFPAMVAIAAGLVLVGCSQRSNPEVVTSAVEESGGPGTEASSRDVRNVRWWSDESILAELQLTDDQVRRIHEVMRVSSRHDGEQRQRERRLSVNYLRALAQEPYDPALVDRVSERLIGVLSERSRRRVEDLRAVRDVLTQEQWTRLWEVAPRAVQIGRVRVVRGPKVSVSDTEEAPTSTP